MSKSKCPECGNVYDRIGQHWAFNESHRPDLTDYQKKVVRGLLLGDGCVSTEGGAANSVFIVEMANEAFISWVDDVFGCLSRGYKMSKTAKESHDGWQQSQMFTDRPPVENFSDLYRTELRPHPYYTDLRSWYSTGRKKYELDTITGEEMRMWYVSDGTLDTRSSNRTPFVSITNTVQINDSGFCALFDETPFDVTFSNDKVRIPPRHTEIFFDYIGDPAPGFEYKWIEGYK